MSDTFRRLLDLIQRGEVLISAHGYDEMAEDGIFAGEVIEGVGGQKISCGGGHEHEASYEVRPRGSIRRRG